MSVYATTREKIADVAEELCNDSKLMGALAGIKRDIHRSLQRVNEYRGREDSGPIYSSLLPKFNPFKPTSEDYVYARLARVANLDYDLKLAEIDLPLGYKPTENDDGYPYAEDMYISVPLFADAADGRIQVAKMNFIAQFTHENWKGVGAYSWFPTTIEGRNRAVNVDELSLEKALEFAASKKKAAKNK
jgi:hypothetical protein